jgi:hypothetical protein
MHKQCEESTWQLQINCIKPGQINKSSCIKVQVV